MHEIYLAIAHVYRDRASKSDIVLSPSRARAAEDAYYSRFSEFPLSRLWRQYSALGGSRQNCAAEKSSRALANHPANDCGCREPATVSKPDFRKTPLGATADG